MYSVSRKTACRLAFVLLGLVPLLATLLFAGWRNRQFDEAYFASLVGRVLGCRTTIEEVTFVRPGLVRLTEVNIADAESGEVFLYLPRIDVHQDQQSIRLAIPEARVHDAAADRLLFLIHERVLRQPDLLVVPISAIVERLQFNQRFLDVVEQEAGAPATQFVGSHFELRQIDLGSELRGALRQIAAKVKPAIELTIRRTLTDLPATTITLQTHDDWLPASLLVGRQRWLPQLSASAKFQGNLHIDADADGWSGEVYGDFRDVDLGQLVGDRFGRFLTGNANAVVHTARFAKNRLQELDVEIDAGPGQFGTRQLNVAAATWGLEWSETPELSSASIDYTQFAARVFLTSAKNGLKLFGLCDPHPGTLLSTPSGAILRHPDERVEAPVSSILGVLLPTEPPPQFSITAEADSLLRILPLPAAND